MNRCATEISGGNVFAHHLLHDSRTREEHLARVLRHENEVAKSRGIASTTGARSHNHSNLRNHARSPDVAGHDGAITGKREHAFVDTGSTAIVHGDKRSTGFHSHIHDAANLFSVALAQGAATHRKVLGGCKHQTAIHLAVTGHDAVTQDDFAFLEHAVARLAECTDFNKRTFVEQHFHAFAGSALSGLVLLIDTSSATSRLGLGQVVIQLGDILFVPHFVKNSCTVSFS